MSAPTIGVLHPGEMGAAIAGALVSNGHRVVWASEGRSEASARRAAKADVQDVMSAAELAAVAAVVLSVVPPAEAATVAASLSSFTGTYVDANAIAPATSRAIADRVTAAGARYVDGGIIGRPPARPGDVRLYLSGETAGEVAALFDGTVVEAPVVSARVGDASALKMAYAGWTKGSGALLLAMREFAARAGVQDALTAEWSRSIPDLQDRWTSARASADGKGWRWIGEMQEISRALESLGLPPGFHDAAAAIFAESDHDSGQRTSPPCSQRSPAA
jgi:3-hydroxyisobutyrate dehydrogenase-like beta-hydroxyacid dehydrogenase